MSIKEQPFFYGLFSNDLGRIWVLRDNPGAKSKEDLAPKQYDIYSRDGFYLYRATLPYGRRVVIRNGCLWTTYSDEEKGLLLIKGFKIKNWPEIKTSI